ncbi:MAG: hypothetical protein ABF868_10870 [Sporolactobacillus sp.]
MPIADDPHKYLIAIAGMVGKEMHARYEQWIARFLCRPVLTVTIDT